ncbi:hypothetical protein [Ferribacterium limneticum]|uniref:hypothetical protein n=1 Tax=Ferribacterium limneticum TaxID=76259 RepID=UPI001CF8DB61|nr:hypothetical protein [Ferribacterium limneticum]UCV22559.1 hypothetical protein KI613_18930 [Ferribacterium limneticum]
MNFWSTAMKIVVKMDLEQGRGSICWKGANWRLVWWPCVTVGGLLVAGNLMGDRLDPPITQTNTDTTKPAPTLRFSISIRMLAL